MATVKYPLQAAREVRQHAIDETKEGLRRARDAETQADETLERAERAIVDHDQNLRAVRRQEAAQSIFDGASLSRQQAFEQRLRAERKRLVSQREEAKTGLQSARLRVEKAMETLAQARAEKEAVERHYQRWCAEQKYKAEQWTEAEADDLVSARFGRQ